VLHSLQQYLFKFGRVGIPGIGTLEIVQEAPRLDVADKQMQPPRYRLQLLAQTGVSNHQQRYFARLHQGPGSLDEYGNRLRTSLQTSPYRIAGLGTLRLSGNSVVLDALDIQPGSLVAVPADKVIRRDVKHAMLVGDRQMTGEQVNEWRQAKKRMPVYVLAGWILLGLALIAIIVLLAMGKFSSSGVGLRTKALFFLPALFRLRS